MLNYYPAVSEAFYSDIPLVVISADRLPHRIDVGDGQTIRQPEVFEPHLEASAYLKPDVIHASETLLANPSQKLVSSNASKLSHSELSRIRITVDQLRKIGTIYTTHVYFPFIMCHIGKGSDDLRSSCPFK